MGKMQATNQITLAVFEFEDLSLQKNLGIFCRSFSTDLVTELSKFKQFRVANCPVYFLNADDTRSALFDELNADYFIQGSFRYANEQVRINVQLYNSHTRHLVWANRLEGRLTDIGELHENLLLQVTGILQQQINYDLLSKLKKKTKVDFTAYECWLYGMEELRKGSVENDLKAREHFEKAIGIQPDYALAYSGVSLTYFNEWSCQLWDRWDMCKSGAFEWAQKAIELDDQNYIAAMVLGKIFLYEGSYETAEYYLRKSLLLNQNDPDVLIQIAAYMALLGLLDEAIAIYERVVKLDPLHVNKYMPYGALIFFEKGEFEKAASLIVRGHTPLWADAEAYFAAIYYYLEQFDKMKMHWDNFLSTYRKLISKGKEFDNEDPHRWLLTINPHKHQSNLERFLQFISKGNVTIRQPVKTGFSADAGRANYFLKEGVIWKISFEGGEAQLQEVKGLYDIQKMLARPRQLFHCAELMGTLLNEKGERLFDSKARKEYEKKILKLQIDMQDAEKLSDFVRLEKLQDEYDQLIDHLSQSLGFKGKARETGSTIEKARSAITWRIRNAIAKIECQHNLLGAHLANAIKTGTFCTYQPERPLAWITS